MIFKDFLRTGVWGGLSANDIFVRGQGKGTYSIRLIIRNSFPFFFEGVYLQAMFKFCWNLNIKVSESLGERLRVGSSTR